MAFWAKITEGFGGGTNMQAATEALDVLIVDDEVDIALDLAEWLARKGLNVATAPDGVAAMELLADHTPRFVVTDLRMPRMSGFDLVDKVRALKGADAPAFIVLSGHGAVFEQQRAAKLNAHAVLEKPVNLKMLLGLLAD